MTNNNSQKGFGVPVTIIIIGFVIVVAGAAYYAIQPQEQKAEMVQEKAMMEKAAEDMMEENEKTMGDDESMMKEDDAMKKDGEAMMEEGGSDGGAVMDEENAMKKDGEAMMEEEGSDGSAMMEEGGDAKDKMSFSGEVISGSTSPLLEFNELDYVAVLASDRLVVLYFYASWCPICKKEFKDTKTAFDELTADNVVGFRVHFNDNETTSKDKSLAKEFGVGYQHTKVFIKNGERVLKSPETWSKARYIEEIGNFLNS